MKFREAPAYARAYQFLPQVFLKKRIAPPLDSCCWSRFRPPFAHLRLQAHPTSRSLPARPSSESSFTSHPLSPWVIFDHTPARLDSPSPLALLQCFRSSAELCRRGRSIHRTAREILPKVSVEERQSSRGAAVFRNGTGRQSVDDSALWRCKPA